MTTAPREIAILAISEAGAAIAARIDAALPEAEIWVAAPFAAEAGPGAQAFDQPLPDLTGRLFPARAGLVLVMTLDAAVRLLAPHIRDEHTGPAIVAVDGQAGRFAVSLLSGRASGETLAERVALATGAVPVITTSAGPEPLAAPERFGHHLGWTIERREHLPRLATALARGDLVALYQDAGERDWYPGDLPRHIIPYMSFDALDEAPPAAAIVITDRDLSGIPLPDGTVVYHPKSLVVGIDCRPGASPEAIAHLVDRALRNTGLSPACIATLATSEHTSTEAGLLAFAQSRGLTIRAYPAGVLDTTPGRTPGSRPSPAAPSAPQPVCEAAALLAAGTAALLISERTSSGVSVAVARITPAMLRLPHGEVAS